MTLLLANALALPLRDKSVDAIVCDPPYGLEFMGSEWDGADGFRRSMNPADVERPSVFGRTSRTSPEYRSKARAGMAKLGSIASGDGVLPSYVGGLNPKCRSCGAWQRGANPCGCDDPDFGNERADRMEVFQAWCQTWAEDALRVAKPGAHLIAFGSTRTHHRLHVGVEDAGWEIRDMGVWLYRNGFPKQRHQLKPAIETWLLARRPCSERNVIRCLKDRTLFVAHAADLVRI